LCREGRLNKTKYKRETIMHQWLPALDALARTEPADLPDFLAKLTPNALASSVNSGQPRFSANGPGSAFFVAVAELWDAVSALRTALEQRVLGARRDLVAYARRESETRRHARGVQSFDQLLERLDRALASERGERLARQIAERHPAALIDEFQDTDPLQYGI